MMGFGKKLVWGSLGVLLVAAVVLAYLRTRPCRNGWGWPVPTGLMPGRSDFELTGFSLLETKACFLGTDKTVDQIFPETSRRILIGYFDRMGWLHKYPARLGGRDDSGRVMGVSFCDKGVCGLVSPEEAIDRMSQGAVAGFQLIYRDANPWKNARQLRQNVGVVDKLVKGIKTGWGFPIKMPEDFAFQVWQIRLLEERPK